VASVIRNLTRGISRLIEQDEEFQNVQVNVLHGPAGPPAYFSRLNYEEYRQRMALGRFFAESYYGLGPSRSIDSTLFTNYFTPPVCNSRRTVTIIHDLFHHHFPELVSSRKRGWLRHCHLQTLRKADKVVTISQAVKQDVLDVYGSRHESRIQPIWNPIDMERFESEDLEVDFTEGRPYVLGVAVDRPSKNLATLVRAFHILHQRFPELLLVLCGELRSRDPKFREPVKSEFQRMPSTIELVEQLKLGGRVKVTGFVTDSQLGALYRGASAFVMPSLFEGFGMPPIEAMALGVPTIVSGIPVLREVTLGMAEYIDDPCDEGEIANRIERVLQAGKLTRLPVVCSNEVRERFAPETIAKQYLNILLK